MFGIDLLESTISNKDSNSIRLEANPKCKGIPTPNIYFKHTLVLGLNIAKNSVASLFEK